MPQHSQNYRDGSLFAQLGAILVGLGYGPYRSLPAPRFL